MFDIRDHGGTFGSGKYAKGKKIKDIDLSLNPLGTIVNQSTAVSYAARIFKGTDGHLYVLGSLIYRVDKDLNVIASSNAWSAAPVNGLSVDPFNNVWIAGNYGEYSKINLDTLTLVFKKEYYNVRDIAHDSLGNAYIIATNNVLSVDNDGNTRWSASSISQNGGKVIMGSNGDVYFMFGGNSNNSTSEVIIRYTTSGVKVSSVLFTVARGLLHIEEIEGYLYLVNVNGSYNNLIKMDMSNNQVVYTTRIRFINDTLLADTQQSGMAIVKNRFIEVYGKGGIYNLHKMTVDESIPSTKLDFYPSLSTPTQSQPKGFLLDEEYVYVCQYINAPNSVLKQLRYNLYTIL